MKECWLNWLRIMLLTGALVFGFGFGFEIKMGARVSCLGCVLVAAQQYR